MSIDLDLATKQEYADLIADVVGHAEGEPTIAELDEMNPDIDRNVIRNRIYRSPMGHRRVRGERGVLAHRRSSRGIRRGWRVPPGGVAPTAIPCENG